MKFLLCLLLINHVIQSAKSVEGSGEDVADASVSEASSTSLPSYSLSFQEDEQPVRYVKLCNQLHYKICNQRIGKENAACTSKCSHHLQSFLPTEKSLECFAPIEELKRWDKCLEDNTDLFFSTSVKVPESEINRFNYTLDQEYDRFKTQTGGVILKKARKAFVAFRGFQHCYIHCMKRYEQTCHGMFNCAISYPEPEDMVTIMKECHGLGKIVLDNTRDTCKCLQEGHKVMKLFGQCSLMGSRVFMRRI
ncbi:unnamed protein product [Bursaphelenchus okinawaensis]|uniref:Uncharacterized protein n=1 Tax=Bursaphelenchus okinawaensis TaxID=465554 RepID=A0A811JRX4_9BILA|nr:unnamed protein product [Bursaphelenchus okinawaensis]CAG9079802.1 unnamed protein product [Bursaphelenchus okinawaensis]